MIRYYLMLLCIMCCSFSSLSENITKIIDGKVLPSDHKIFCQKLKSSDENIILGKAVKFSAPPNQFYKQLKTAKEYSLTDGVFYKNRKLRFCKDVPVWRETTKLYFYFDLGKVSPIGTVAIHSDGGGSNARFTKRAPGGIKIYGGIEPDKYQLLGLFNKQKALKKSWMPDEKGKYWSGWFTFSKVNTNVRYLLFEIDAMGSCPNFDEVLVLKAAKSNKINSIDKTDYNYRFSYDFNIYAHKDKSIIPIGAYCYENFGRICNFEKDDTEVKLKIETPDWLNIGWFAIGRKNYDCAGHSIEKNAEKISPIISNGKKIYNFTFKSSKVKRNKTFITLYWKAEPKKQKNQKGEIVFKTSWNSGRNEWKQPVEAKSIPNIKASDFNKLFLCQSRLYRHVIDRWPDFIESYKKFGFNTAMLRHPTPKHIKLFKKNNIKIVLWLTEWYRMKELNCIIKGGKKGRRGKAFGKNCPSYRGKAYKEGIDRIVKAVEKTKPAIVFFDFEWWGFDGPECEYCERCQAYKKKLNIADWDKFKIAMGNEIWDDIYFAIKQNSIEKQYPLPQFGMYEITGIVDYQKVWNFSYLHKHGLTYEMPSCYLALDSPHAMQQIKDYLSPFIKRTGGRNIMPWLSLGDHGEYPSSNFGEILLWGLQKGFPGYLFWSERSWAGDDFIAFAEAVSKYSKSK